MSSAAATSSAVVTLPSSQAQASSSMLPAGGCFTVVIHGTIQGAECPESDVLYCRSRLVKGKEWSVVSMGAERANTVDVVTQQAEVETSGPGARFTWNAPFEVVLQSTNPHGWPQLALGLGSIDASGRDHVAAYARCHVPMQNGNHTLTLPLLQPAYSTPQHDFFGNFAPTPELRDFTFLCSTSDDRVVLSAKPVPGFVRVSFSVMISGMEELGYSL